MNRTISTQRGRRSLRPITACLCVGLANVALAKPNEEMTLLDAIHEGNERFARDFLDKEAWLIDAPMTDGETLLMRAVTDGQTRIVELLLRRGSKVDRMNRVGMTAFGLAVSGGRLDIASRLLRAGASVNGRPHGMPPLVLSAFGRSADNLKFLLGKGASIDRTDQFGNTALILATRLGRKNVVRFLLQARANRELQDWRGYSALSYAMEHDRPDLVEILDARPPAKIRTGRGSRVRGGVPGSPQ